MMNEYDDDMLQINSDVEEAKKNVEENILEKSNNRARKSRRRNKIKNEEFSDNTGPTTDLQDDNCSISSDFTESTNGSLSSLTSNSSLSSKVMLELIKNRTGKTVSNEEWLEEFINKRNETLQKYNTSSSNNLRRHLKKQLSQVNQISDRHLNAIDETTLYPYNNRKSKKDESSSRLSDTTPRLLTISDASNLEDLTAYCATAGGSNSPYDDFVVVDGWIEPTFLTNSATELENIELGKEKSNGSTPSTSIESESVNQDEEYAEEGDGEEQTHGANTAISTQTLAAKSRIKKESESTQSKETNPENKDIKKPSLVTSETMNPLSPTDTDTNLNTDTTELESLSEGPANLSNFITNRETEISNISSNVDDGEGSVDASIGVVSQASETPSTIIEEPENTSDCGENNGAPTSLSSELDKMKLAVADSCDGTTIISSAKTSTTCQSSITKKRRRKKKKKTDAENRRKSIDNGAFSIWKQKEQWFAD